MNCDYLGALIFLFFDFYIKNLLILHNPSVDIIISQVNDSENIKESIMKTNATPLFSVGWCAMALMTAANVAFAQISTSGDVSPVDPTTWTSGTTATIGSVAGGSGTVTVASGGTLLGKTLYVGGQSASGLLTVNNGGMVSLSEGFYVGSEAGSSGTALIDGGTVNYNGDFIVNTGSFTVKNGAVVNSKNDYSTMWIVTASQAIVDGAGTQWNAASYVNAQIWGGALTVSNGAHMTSGRAVLQNGASVRLEGAETLWRVATPVGVASISMYAGGDDLASSLQILNGATLQSGSVTLSSMAPSARLSVLIDGENSLLQMDGNLRMESFYYVPGSSPSTVLTVSNGATLNVSGGIGLSATQGNRNSYGSNTIVVDGGTLNYAGSFGLGSNEIPGTSGSVTIRNGGVINQTNILSQIWMASGSEITIEGAGSQWNATSLNPFGIYGTLAILDGGYMRTGRAHLSGGSNVHVDGASSQWTVNNGNGAYGELGIYKSLGESSFLEVTNGGVVHVDSNIQVMIFSSDYTEGVARAVVDGANSRLNADGVLKMAYGAYISIYSPTAALVVSNGGAVNVGQRMELYKYGYYSGTNTISVDAFSALTVGSTSGQLGQVTIGQDGYMSLADHSLLNAGGDLAVTGNGVLAINTPSVVSVANNMSIGVDATVTVVMNEAATALQVGGNLTNSGTIKLTASDALTTVSTPISVAGTWANADTAKYIAYGGTWDDATKIFTPAAVQAVTTTSQVTVSGGQTVDGYVASVSTGTATGARLWVGNTAEATPSVMLNFSTSTTSADIGVVTCQTSDVQASSLVSTALASGLSSASDRGSWVFYLDGQLDGEVMMGIALSDYDPRTEALSIWHYDTDSGAWTLYTLNDYFVSDGYAYFTVDGFSGYGVVATAIPEPAAIAGASLLAALVFLRRRMTV